MTNPNPQDPLSPLYEFIVTQPTDEYPIQRISSPSHFTLRQFTPEDISQASRCLVTKTAHGLSNGQAIRATKFISMPFAVATGMEQLNNREFYVQQATADTFILSGKDTLPIDSSAYTAYISGGQFTTTGTIIVGNPAAFETAGLVVNPSHFPPLGIPSILDA